MICRNLLALSMIALLWLAGCKNEGPDPVILFSLTVPEGYNSEGLHTVVISDKLGQILVRQVVVGIVENEFIGLPTSEPFNITFIGPIIEIGMMPGTGGAGQFQNIETYLDVSPGTRWNLELNDTIPRIGSTEISFLNVIQNENILVSTKGEDLPESFTNQIVEGESYSLNLIENIQEVYVKINPTGSNQHQFRFFDASISQTQQIDLIMVQNTMQKDIQIPFSNISSTFVLKNLSRSNPFNSQTLDFSFVPLVTNVLTLNFPPNRYNEFIASVTTITPSSIFTEVTYGTIQESMTKLEVEFIFVSKELSNFKVETLGSYDFLSGLFYLPINSGNNQMNWRIFSKQSNTVEFVLPDFSFCATCEFLTSVNDLQYHSIEVSEFILLGLEFNYESFFQYTQTGYLNLAVMSFLRKQKEIE